MTRIKLLIASLAVFTLAGCTQNNGHIGRLFGSWVLEQAMLNGVDMPMPAGTDTYWSFQADIVRVTLEEDHYAASSYFGTFRELPDGILELNFDHRDDANAEGAGAYAAPVWMGFPAKGVFTVQASGSGSKLKLVYQRSADKIYEYYFTKSW